MSHNDDTLSALNEQVDQFEAFSNHAYRYYHRIEDGLFYIRFFLTIIIFMGVILPMAKRLKNQLDELKLLNENYRAQKEKAQDYVKLKSDFFARMSHELRTPINAIIGYSEMLAEDMPDATHQKDLEKVLISARHLLIMINEILDISKIEAGASKISYTQVNFYTLCNDIIDIITPLAHKNKNDLRYIFSLRSPLITTDPDKIKQVLLNVLSNACKFTKNGTILLEVTEDSLIKDRLKIKIQDSGKGIAPDELKRIFEPFVQANNRIAQEYGGTGLGLAISKSFLSAMNADFHVESVVGKGTTFMIELPKLTPLNSAKSMTSAA